MRIEDIIPLATQSDPQLNFGEVTHDGVFPDGAHLTTNQVEVFNLNGQWVLPKQPRMDGVARRKVNSDGEEELEIVEMNKLHKGDQVF